MQSRRSAFRLRRLIENNTRRIAILEEIVQTIYREWFVEFRFPGHENVRLVNTHSGRIPNGWTLNHLGDLAEEVRRAVQPSEIEPDTPYFGLEHFPRRSITLGEWGRAKDVQSTKLAFKQGEILFGKIRPYFHKVGFAPLDGVCSSDVIVIVPNSPSAFGPVLCCVSSDGFVRHATQTSQGTKMPRANWDVLVKYPVPVPPEAMLTKFNSYISDVVANLRLLMLKNRKLRETRDLLLPKLISGQLDVEGLEVDTGIETEVLIDSPTKTIALPLPSKAIPVRLPKPTPYKNDAAILCVVIHELLKANRSTSEFFVQKHAFALKHRRELPLNCKFTAMAAGPWSHELKRKAIFAGQKTGWLSFNEATNALEEGRNIAAGLDYARRVLGERYAEVQGMVVDLVGFGNSGLERWMTVFKVVCDLKEKGTSVTRASIQKGIDNWKGKRAKPDFSIQMVDQTINGMVKHGWFSVV